MATPLSHNPLPSPDKQIQNLTKNGNFYNNFGLSFPGKLFRKSLPVNLKLFKYKCSSTPLLPYMQGSPGNSSIFLETAIRSIWLSRNNQILKDTYLQPSTIKKNSIMFKAADFWHNLPCKLPSSHTFQSSNPPVSKIKVFSQNKTLSSLVLFSYALVCLFQLLFSIACCLVLLECTKCTKNNLYCVLFSFT